MRSERLRTFVFLGPTMPAGEAAALLDATFLPPVQRGDVLGLLPSKPHAIGIVDGYFDTVPSVWHKEILVAMAQGVHVFGAASMGALRAAELDTFGMVGVGQVYEWFRAGVLDADDEVAVAHGADDTGFVRLSDALVDIRDVCLRAEQAGVLRSEDATRLIGMARARFYPDRSVRATIEDAADEAIEPGAAARLERFVATSGPRLKERDARAMLGRLADLVATDRDPLRVDYRVERTVFLDRLQHEVDQLPLEGSHLPTDVEAAAVEAAGEPLPVLRKKALLRLLARGEAARIGLRVDEEEMQVAADTFRRQFGLLTAAETEAWAAAAGVTDDMFVELLRDGVLVDKLERFYSHRVGATLASQMRMATAARWGEGDAAPEG